MNLQSFKIPIYVALAISIAVFFYNMVFYFFLKKSKIEIKEYTIFYDISFHLLKFKSHGIIFKLGYLFLGGYVKPKDESNNEQSDYLIENIIFKTLAIKTLVLVVLIFFIQRSLDSYLMINNFLKEFIQFLTNGLNYEAFSFFFDEQFQNSNRFVFILVMVYFFSIFSSFIQVKKEKIMKVLFNVLLLFFWIFYLLIFYKIFSNISLLSFGIFYISTLLSSLVFLFFSSLIIKN